MHALLHQEKQRHHDQGHVVVPCEPTACLIVCHAHFALGTPEISLDDVALDPIANESAWILIRRTVAQGVVTTRCFGFAAVVGAFVGL